MKKNSKAIWEYIKENKENVIFVVYLALTFFFLVLHQNHRDEAQAWLLSRDCSLLELIESLKYEGHFLLWYLILCPFAKLGFPYHTMNVISWLFCSIALYLFLKKAPFSLKIKILVAFSYPFLYGYSIISRCYCLIPLALILICLNYKDKIEKPFSYLASILFLSNTHIVVEIFVCILIVDYIFELQKRWNSLNTDIKQKHKLGIMFFIVFMFLSFYPLLSCLSACQETKITPLTPLIQFMIFAFYPFVSFYEFFRHLILIRFLNYQLIFYMVCTIFIYYIFYLWFKYEKRSFYWFLICYLYQIFIYIYIYPFNMFTKYTLFFFVITINWIFNIKNQNLISKQNSINQKPAIKIFWGLCGIHSILTILSFLLIPTVFIYSYTKEMADFINQNVPQNSIICIGGNFSKASSLIPYIHNDKNIKFYQLPAERFLTYTIWDEKNRYVLNENTIHNLKKFDSDNIYYISYDKGYFDNYCANDNELLFAYENELENNGILECIIDMDGQQVMDEEYKLYKVNMQKLNKTYK